MNIHKNAKADFDQKLSELKEGNQPSLLPSNLPEIVLYEKLPELQSQLNNLEKRLINKQY
jgi:hypothetical protein